MTSTTPSNTSWKRWLSHIVVWTAFALITLVVLVHFGTNWFGARAWVRAQNEVVHSGETLDFKRIAADPAPEAGNFGSLPLFENFALQDDSEAGKKALAAREKLAVLALPSGKEGDKMRLGSKPRLSKGLDFGQKADLAAWAVWLRQEGTLNLPPDSGNAAQDILKGMAAHNPLVQELTSGLDRPASQWTPAWKTRQLPGIAFSLALPHYQTLQSMSGWLSFRAIAAARAADAKAAHESLLVLIKLIQATEQDPLLIGTLVAATIAHQTAYAVWEVCEARVGTAEDFHRLQRELAKLDPSASLLRAHRAEMATMASSIQWLRNHPDSSLLSGVLGDPGKEKQVALGLKVIPKGWFDANAAKTVSLQLRYIIEPLRDHGLGGALARQDELNDLLRAYSSTPLLHLDSIFARLALPAFQKVTERVAGIQSRLLQARAASALEAYWLAHKKYPASLEALQDASGGQLVLPPDSLTEQALDYQATADGRYRLWTWGMDRKNDAGKVNLKTDSPENTKFYTEGYQGDWVWGYTPAF